MDVSNPFLGRGGVPGYVHFTNKQKLIASECQQNLSREFILLSNATCSRTGLLCIRAEIKEHFCTERFWVPPPLSLLHQAGSYFWSHCQAKLLLLITKHSHFSPSSSQPWKPNASIVVYSAGKWDRREEKRQLLAGSLPLQRGCCQGVFLFVHSPASAIHTLTDSHLLLLIGGRLDIE